jgi:WD40 repeat protein
MTPGKPPSEPLTVRIAMIKTLATGLLITAVAAARADDPVIELKGHEGPTSVVRFTPDTTKLVSCSGGPEGDKAIRVWDTQTWKELHKLTGHTGGVDALCVSRDSKLILSGGSDGTARVWETDTGKEVMTFKGHKKAAVTAAAFSAVVSMVYTGDVNGNIIFWSAGNAFEQFNIPAHEDRVSCLQFMLNKEWLLVSGSLDGTVKVWDAATGRLKKMITIPGAKVKVENIALTPDGKEVVVACERLSRWDIQTGKETKNYSAGAVSVSISKDGTKLLTGSADGTMILRDLASGTELARHAAHKGRVNWVEFAPYEKAAASAGGGTIVDGKYTKGTDFAVRVWEIEK